MSQQDFAEVVNTEHVSDRDGENINAKRAGLYAYDGSAGQWRRVAANASGQITVSASSSGITPSTRSLTLTQPAAGLTVTNSGVAQDLSADRSWTFALSNDLSALEGLGSTGYPKRTGTDTWSQVTTIPIADGGTNGTSYTTNGVLRYDGSKFANSSNFTHDGTNIALAGAGTLTLGGDWIINRSGASQAFIFGKLNLAVPDSTATGAGADGGRMIAAGIGLNPASSSGARVWGLTFTAEGKGSQNLTNTFAINGFEGGGLYSGSATVTGVTAGYIYNLHTGTGTITESIGLYLDGHANLSTGTYTRVYLAKTSMYHPPFSANSQTRVGYYAGATLDPGSYTGTTAAAIQLAGTSGAARDGILFAFDTNLYRSAADTLKTDDSLVVGGTVTATGGVASGLPTTNVTGTSQTAVAGNGYVTNNASLVTITLPTPALGSVIEITGLGAGGWKAQCGSGHTIRLGTTVSASTGYAASTDQYDSVRILGVSTTQWHIVSSVGTLDIT